MHICIIGAGIIGTTTAWELAQHGHRITLLEAREDAGLETSYANAGQLSYSYVAPLAEPSVLPNLPQWLLDSQSPLQFRPRLDVQQWRWGLAFLSACRADMAQRTKAQMLSLSYLSRDTLAQWQAQTRLDFAWCEAGKLIVYRSRKAWEKAQKAAQTESGEEIWDAAKCLRREPALTGLGEQIAGGIYAADSAVADCHALSQCLASKLRALPNASMRTSARVVALERSQGRITTARLASGEHIEADHFVLSNALGACPLLRALGEDVPLYGLKGYSLSVPLTANDSAPHISVTDYERRIVYARIGGVLRIAAMVDMGDTSTQPNPARMALLQRQVAEIFPHLPLEKAQVWAGLRPATPDSKPRIGRSKVATNAWLNLGHGALGFTLACGSAVLLRHLMESSNPPIDTAPFQP